MIVMEKYKSASYEDDAAHSLGVVQERLLFLEERGASVLQLLRNFHLLLCLSVIKRLLQLPTP